MKTRPFLQRSYLQICALTLSLAVIGAPIPAEASSYEVACGDPTGLVNAIILANVSAGADTVVLNPAHQTGCTYTFSNGYSSGYSALPTLLYTLTIEGNGATIERSATATQRFRLLYVGAGAAVTINDLTIRNGSIKGTDGGAGAAGATGSAGTNGAFPSGNGTAGGAGGVGSAGVAGGSGQGGGIYVVSGGQLTLHNCAVTGNRADGGAGGAGGLGGPGGTGGTGANGRDGACDWFSCTSATVGGAGGAGGNGGSGGAGGYGGQGQGGGVYNAGSLTIQAGTVSGNAAAGGAGGSGGLGGVAVQGAAGGQGGDADCEGVAGTPAANGGKGGGGGSGGDGGVGGGGGQGNGGGIFNAGALTMDGVTITSNLQNSGGSGGGATRSGMAAKAARVAPAEPGCSFVRLVLGTRLAAPAPTGRRGSRAPAGRVGMPPAPTAAARTATQPPR